MALAMVAGLMAQAQNAPVPQVAPSAATLCQANDRSALPVVAKRFLLAQLALSPVEAAAAGLHSYEGRNLDREMDDFSPASLEAQHIMMVVVM